MTRSYSHGNCPTTNLYERRYDTSFPGDHSDKQVGRLLLYKHAIAAPIQGHAITLTGNDPGSELKLMRYYLKWPAHRVWFADKSKEADVKDALKLIKKQWPEANVYAGNVRTLVPRLSALGFANLDFMGAPLKEDNIQCLSEVSDRLLPGSILGLTWIRGREDLTLHTSARLLYKLGKGYTGNERRWAGVVKAINIISGKTLTLIDRYEYQSNCSPMSVAVFKKGA